MPTVAPSTTTAAPTSTTTSTSTTTTQPAPPPNLLAGVTWIQQAYLSPCGDGTTVQMIGGGGVVNGSRAVLDDVIALDPTKGRALAFLSCHQPNGTVSAVVALPVTAAGDVLTPGTPTSLGAGAHVVAASPHAFVVELPDPDAPAALWRRRSYTVGDDGIALASDRQISALQRTIARPPTVGDAVRLVQGSVQPADLCYAWNNVSLAPQDPPALDASDPIPDPSAEIQTIRLALILLTRVVDRPDVGGVAADGRGHPRLPGVARARRRRRDRSADHRRLALRPRLWRDRLVPHGRSPALGQRLYATPGALLADAERYARTGHSTDPSLDALLAAAGWDGAHSFFLGCERYESPEAGLRGVERHYAGGSWSASSTTRRRPACTTSRC